MQTLDRFTFESLGVLTPELKSWNPGLPYPHIRTGTWWLFFYREYPYYSRISAFKLLLYVVEVGAQLVGESRSSATISILRSLRGYSASTRADVHIVYCRLTQLLFSLVPIAWMHIFISLYFSHRLPTQFPVSAWGTLRHLIYHFP